MTNHFSRYPNITRPKSLTTQAVVTHCKSIFARHGVPEIVVSDNGPQFSRVVTSAFATFDKEHGFTDVTSSPRYPQSKRFSEAAVKVIKTSMSNTGEPRETLLSYLTTALKNGHRAQPCGTPHGKTPPVKSTYSKQDAASNDPRPRPTEELRETKSATTTKGLQSPPRSE